MSDKWTALRLHCLRKGARYCCLVTEQDKSEELIRTVELELANKRAQWERDREKQRTVRLLGFSVLSLIILGTLLAIFVLFSRAKEIRGSRAGTPSISASPKP